MTVNYSLYPCDDCKEPADASLTCTNCKTDEHLMVESIQPHVPRAQGRVAMEYSCTGCGAFFAHGASVQSVAKVLAKQPGRAGVLHFGRYYIHCGEPMERGEIRLSTLKLPEGDAAEAPAVTVPSVVLRCQCGFQMSMPAE